VWSFTLSANEWRTWTCTPHSACAALWHILFAYFASKPRLPVHPLSTAPVTDHSTASRAAAAAADAAAHSLFPSSRHHPTHDTTPQGVAANPRGEGSGPYGCQYRVQAQIWQQDQCVQVCWLDGMHRKGGPPGEGAVMLQQMGGRNSIAWCLAHFRLRISELVLYRHTECMSICMGTANCPARIVKQPSCVCKVRRDGVVRVLSHACKSGIRR
jgi:hypothetical protein